MKQIEVRELAPATDVGRVLAEYEAWLLSERGLAEITVVSYLRGARWFALDYLGGDYDQLVGLGAADVSAAVLGLSPPYSRKSVNVVVVQLRSLLRYLHLKGLVGAPLAQAVPWLAGGRTSSLPRSLPAGRAELLLASCDRRTLVGARDYAVLTVLVRLGLRRAEVAAMQLSDLDWRHGELTVHGKGGTQDVLPLPVDVGKAVVAYLKARGRTPGSRSLFDHVRAPGGGITPSDVSAIVRRACQRADVMDTGTHRLRHGVATEMLRRGAPLHEIGQLLRHRDLETTAIYAKVDLGALATLARPWPAVTR